MSDLVVYRDNPLTLEDFQKLTKAIENKIYFKQKYDRVVFTEKDEYGDLVERSDYVECGFDVQLREEIPDALLKSIQRPARKSHIAAHLKRLELHKRYSRGSAAWDLIIEDLCNDLDGVSEYAVIKSCEAFRLDAESPFFPDGGKLVKYIKTLDDGFKNMAAKEEAPIRNTTVEERIPVKTEKSKRRVSKLLKIGMKADAFRTKWEKRWYAYIVKNGVSFEEIKTETRNYHS